MQRARVEALRQAGAVDAVVTAALLDELDGRIALLGERLAAASASAEDGRPATG